MIFVKILLVVLLLPITLPVRLLGISLGVLGRFLQWLGRD